MSLLACQGLCGRFCCHSVHNKDHGGSQPINKELLSKVITYYCTLLYKAISKSSKNPTEKVLRQVLSTKHGKHSSNMYDSLWPLDLEACLELLRFHFVHFYLPEGLSGTAHLHRSPGYLKGVLRKRRKGKRMST